VRNVIIDKEIV